MPSFILQTRFGIFMILLKKWFVPVLAGFSAASAFVCTKAPAEWQEGFVFANGIRLHYLRSGCSKPALVYAHDAGETASSGILFAENFRHDFDVVLYDARGHGQSGKRDSLYSIEQHVEDLCGMIRRLPVDSPICVGKGMGASTACWLAALHPESVRALILIQPSGQLNPTASTSPMACPVSNERMRQKISLLNEETPPPAAGNFHSAEQESRLRDLPTVQGGSPGTEMQEALQRISCPVLILFSSEPSAFRAFDEKMLRSETSSSLQTDSCGTINNREAVRVIRSFLRHSVLSPPQIPPSGR